MKTLVALKSNIELQDKNGESPLHISAMNSNILILRFLLDAKADVNAMGNGKHRYSLCLALLVQTYTY